KVISGLSELCKLHKKPLSLFCGKNSLSDEELSQNGISGAYAINSIAKSPEDSMNNAYNLLSELAYRYAMDLVDKS
ncbi:MAG: glycerate kinase, partial [Sphingobacteriaceae bacterium]